MQQELKYIYQIYEDGSFSKAADHLFISQPALSIAIQKIESSIGMPLFDRSHRPLRLTSAGELYIRMIKKIRGLEHDLDQQIQDIQQLNTGSIRIGGSHYVNAYILPEIVTDFSRDYPGISIDMLEESSDVLGEMLAERKIDLTFSCDPKLVKRFKQYPFFLDHILLAVPENYSINSQLSGLSLTGTDILRGKHLTDTCPTVSLNNFRDLEFIILTPGNNLYQRAIQLFESAGFKPKIKMEQSQLATAYHLAEAGFAATFVSDRMIQKKEASLLFYKIDSDLCRRMFYALVPHENYTSIPVQKFITFYRDSRLHMRYSHIR